MFETLVGQDHIKKQLGFYRKAHSVSGLTPFLMFNGAKGLGKTEFAKEFAKSLGKPLLEINCSTIKNSAQFFEQIFMPVIMDNDITILFDEAHALPKDLVMAFLTVFNVEGVNRKHFEWRENSFEFNFERQTYIFATTEQDKLFDPFKARLTIIDFKRSKEIEMYCESDNIHVFNRTHWKDLCGLVNIKPYGLTNSEIEVLSILKDRGECTLNMLAAAKEHVDGGLSIVQPVMTIKIERTRHITPLGIQALSTILAN